MKQHLVICALFGAVLAAACHRDSGGGITAVRGGFPPASSPSEVSSSAQVVKVTASPMQIPAGGSSETTIELSIMPGYHVNANPATYPYLIATEVQHTVDPDDSMNIGKPRYPPATKEKFQFADEQLDVYEGIVKIAVPIKAEGPNQYGYQPRGAKFDWDVTVRVQACDSEKCFPPATLNATVPVEVK